MTSTNHTTIATRVSQCLAATALMAGLAIGTAAIASAEREWDLGVYDDCMKGEDPGNQSMVRTCCLLSGGVWVDRKIGQPGYCTAPAPLQNPEGQPGPTEPPPVLQNPPAQPSSPLIPTPRGPNSGTLG